MKATYDGRKLLNVREVPRPGAAVVRQMAPGETVGCSMVDHGWAVLDGGYAKAEYLVVSGDEPDGSVQEASQDAAPPVEEAAADAQEIPPALASMTRAQLVEMAEQSGVHVTSKATKAEIIAAILADA